MHRISDKLVSFIEPEAVEPQALQQAGRISRMPFIHEHVALMPDVHLGKGATVGSVIATEGAIIPAAVGVDIGCGMIAVKTNLRDRDLPDSLDKLTHSIERAIPTGIGNHGRNKDISNRVSQRTKDLSWNTARDIHQRAFEVDSSWVNQIGTLGGGNHFIELCLDESNVVWLVLHSGSRGIGNKLANIHMKVADRLMKANNVHLEDRDLAYLQENTPEFYDYLRDLMWAQRFALENREEMMDRVFEQLQREVPTVREIHRINSHHNFTQKETHFGKIVWLTRKGAVQTKLGQWGIIPGSMATGTYIVTGLGNKDAFESAPHGAGRKMSRSQAKKEFTLEDLQERMKGISSNVRASLIDEHPGAYKDVTMVIDRSSELVKVEHTLRQVMNVKGD